MDRQARESEQRLKELQAQYKAKEQENRIAKLKIAEMRR